MRRPELRTAAAARGGGPRRDRNSGGRTLPGRWVLLKPGRRHDREQPGSGTQGKPRITSQEYLGTAEELAAAMRGGRLGLPDRVQHREFGAVAAAWGVLEDLDVAGIIDKVCGARRADAGASTGTYLALAALNRVVAPCPKLAFADWWAGTAAPRFTKIPGTVLDHRRFWDAMHAVTLEDLEEVSRNQVLAVAVTTVARKFWIQDLPFGIQCEYPAAMESFKIWAGDDNREALVDPVRNLTIFYGELRERVDACAAGLVRAGAKPGDRIAVCSWTGLEAAVGFLGILRAGCAAMPINPQMTQPELVRNLPAIRPAMALAHDVRELAATFGDFGATVMDLDLTTGPGQSDRPGRPDRAVITLPEVDPGSVALILQTSGTTGASKSVPLTQANLATSSATIASTYQLTPADTTYCIMPLFHVHGLVGVLLTSLSTGGTVLVPARLRMSSFWDVVARSDVTWVSAVPTLLAGIPSGPRDRHRLRFLRSASSPLPPPLAARLESDLGVPVLEAYGMTEATHQVASNPLPPAGRRPGSVGLATGTQIDIVDKAWDSVPEGEPAEVVIRGAAVTSGYLDNPEANAASFKDGWFRTGDVGCLSPDGYLRLVGRIKEMINRGGEKISPREVDDVLLSHPSVIEAATYGVPDSKYGEVVHAAVVTRAGVDPKTLVSHCGDQLAAFKVPRKIHIVESIPKGPTGKIQRSQLATALDVQ